jgi:hypothetical protein
MTSVHCNSDLACDLRSDGLCKSDTIELAGFDAHCSHAEDLRKARHTQQIEIVRAAEKAQRPIKDFWEIEEAKD